MPDPADAGWLVLGAGGHARSVVDVIGRRGDRVVAVVGAAEGGDWEPWGIERLDDDVAAFERIVAEGLRAAVAIGAVEPRLAVVRAILALGGTVPALVAGTATVGGCSAVGHGTVVLEHAHVGPASRLGAGVIVNTAAIVEHDCVVGDGVHVAPGACLLGGVTVGERTLVGSGARVLPGITVGAGVTIAAGAVVTRNVPDDATVVGSPARDLHPDRGSTR
ncbi:serine acetyltransferase [Intrasporangium oryzae NRRL B-24470]|uniref:Serine acetyltransferase n=1 Tax=Intrasporangium oryzae NRRL B-24470 TaxID=1386089 RepID=W9GB91_9MICO|nr:acetyltransferase [Intrasporangium oryzae]EWT01124.1 serine acetyltransferase [Intrasporangium oryzae NRRL B-24470]